MSDWVADELLQEIRDGLRKIIDPELGQDIVGLGLIYDMEAGASGYVRILMTTTVPGCPASEFLVGAVKQAVLAINGVRTVDVQLTHEPRWSPAMMAP